MTDEHLLGGESLASDLTEPYWQALHGRGFALQHCAECGRYQHYPRRMCRWCGRSALAFVPTSGKGVVVAATTLHRTSVPALAPLLPYSMVLVRWQEGPASLAMWGGAAPVAIGERGSGLQGLPVAVDHDATLAARLLTVAEVTP